MKPAGISTRVSGKEQQQRGFSLGAQPKCLREYADRGDFNVLKTFEDVETPNTSGRKQFGAAAHDPAGAIRPVRHRYLTV